MNEQPSIDWASELNAKLVTSPSVPVPPVEPKAEVTGNDDYAQFIAAAGGVIKETHTDAAVGSLMQASDKDPIKAAQAENLSQKMYGTTYMTNAIEQDYDEYQKSDHLNTARGILDTNPKLAKWINDTPNAAAILGIKPDDLSNLSVTEKLFNALGGKGFAMGLEEGDVSLQPRH